MTLPGGRPPRLARNAASRGGGSAIEPAAVTELAAVVCAPARDRRRLGNDAGMAVARGNRCGGSRHAGDCHGRRTVEPGLIPELMRVVRSPTPDDAGASTRAGVPPARGYLDCAGHARDA